MTIKRKKEIYKNIMAALMGGIIVGSPMVIYGCSGKNSKAAKADNGASFLSVEAASVDDSNMYNPDKSYALISFANTVQVIEYRNCVFNGGKTEVVLDTGDTFYTGNSNIITFDITSEKQLNMVNYILEENEKETVPYTYVRK